MAIFFLASPWLVALLGLAIGYFFKRIVLVVVSVPLVLMMLFAGFVMDHREIGGMIALVIGVQCLALLVPMWIMHFVKRAGGLKACLEKLKGATLED